MQNNTPNLHTITFASQQINNIKISKSNEDMKKWKIRWCMKNVRRGQNLANEININSGRVKKIQIQAERIIHINKQQVIFFFIKMNLLCSRYILIYHLTTRNIVMRVHIIVGWFFFYGIETRWKIPFAFLRTYLLIIYLIIAYTIISSAIHLNFLFFIYIYVYICVCLHV